MMVVGGLGYYDFRVSFPKLPVSVGTTHLLAVVVEIPKAPDPKTTEYSDCLSVAKIQVLKVIEGERVPLEMLVAFRIITNRKLTPAAALQMGDHVELTLLKQDQVDERIRTMQRIMETDDFELQFAYAAESYRWHSELVDSFLSDRENSEQPITQTELQPSVSFKDNRSSYSKESRRESIEADVSRIRELLEKHGGTWEKWVEEVKPWRD